MAGVSDDGLSRAARSLADFGLFGVIWLDPELNVIETFGRLADFVAAGHPVTDSIVAMIGLEEEFHSLKRDPKRLLELPAVSLADATEDETPRKLNFTVNWDTDGGRFLVLVYRTGAFSSLELELSTQIRARLMAEEAVKQTSRELERANRDLESFAAIVSHDLKSPLRQMMYLTDLARQELSARSGDDDAREKMGQVFQLGRRMSAMLSALFEYSSLGRKHEAVEDVDTADLIRAITDSLPLSGFNVKIAGDWPQMRTLRAPLDLVLRNLIANAARHHDRSSGSIDILGIDHPLSFEFRVSDDGPGISEKDQGVIFLPFRSLSSDGAASTGMGLAFVQRAVENVGGRISVVSDPAQRRGSTFTVIWPKQTAA